VRIVTIGEIALTMAGFIGRFDTFFPCHTPLLSVVFSAGSAIDEPLQRKYGPLCNAREEFGC
jgi:hypothetical protein